MSSKHRANNKLKVISWRFMTLMISHTFYRLRLKIRGIFLNYQQGGSNQEGLGGGRF